MDSFKASAQNAITIATTTAALPGVAFLCIIGLYASSYYSNESIDFVREGLIMIALQMIPLVVIKIKLLQAVDRVALLSRVSMKVMIMYVSMFILRLGSTP